MQLCRNSTGTYNRFNLKYEKIDFHELSIFYSEVLMSHVYVEKAENRSFWVKIRILKGVIRIVRIAKLPNYSNNYSNLLFEFPSLI